MNRGHCKVTQHRVSKTMMNWSTSYLLEKMEKNRIISCKHAVILYFFNFFPINLNESILQSHCFALLFSSFLFCKVFSSYVY